MTEHIGNSFVIFGYNGRDGVVTDKNGLIYMRARYYDAQVSRFANGDMAEFSVFGRTALVHNLFEYCENDCVNALDDNGY